MIKLYSPRDLAELALIESILEGENIPYFIQNDHFGSLEIGPSIDIFNMKTIMVEEADEERATELLQDFLVRTKEDTKAIQPYSIFDKIRMAFETLFFGWFIPGRHWKKTPP
ncbi:MAG: DUF2007 domain-containing protein [Thermodesulfobacteriota bacterium]|jgi:hypothetical protein